MQLSKTCSQQLSQDEKMEIVSSSLSIYGEGIFHLINSKQLDDSYEIVNRFNRLKELELFQPMKATQSLLVSKEYIQSLNPKSIKEVIAAREENPSIATIAKYRGLLRLNAVLVHQTIWIKSMINVGKELTRNQIVMTASLIIEDYSHYTLQDVKLVYKNAAKGVYGKMYNVLDPVTIMGWFKEYEKERRGVINQMPNPNNSKDNRFDRKGVEIISNMLKDELDRKKKSVGIQTEQNAGKAKEKIEQIKIEFKEYINKWKKENGQIKDVKHYQMIKEAFYNSKLTNNG